MKKLLLFTLIAFAFLGTNAQCVTNVNMSTWAQAGQPANGNWTVQGGGTSVFQSVNNNPTFFVTPFNLINVDISGNFKTTDDDNDWMGFVWSFLNPIGASDSFDTWLFDWKQQQQDGAQSGQSVDYINGVIPSSQYTTDFWNHTNDAEFTVVANDFGGPGWVTGYNHFFELKLTYTHATIYIDNALAFDVQACFKPGRFGFYNYSQASCTYSNFNYSLYVDFTMLQNQMCVGGLDSFLFINGCSTADLSVYNSITWNFGDGDSVVITNPTAATANISHTYTTAGAYNVTLTLLDNAGCSASATHVVTVANPIVLDSVLNQPPCNGGGNGSVSVNATGGFGNYTYSWNSGANMTQTWTGVTAGTYTVSVTDGFCNATAQYTLNQPSALTATTSHVDASCGLDNGSVTINIAGGTPPYQNISWAGVPGATRTGLGPGNYIANFTDANGCSALLQYAETVSSLPCGITDSSIVTNVSCNGGSNGSANIVVTGGTPPETFMWSNGMSGASITGLAAGTYTFTYTDAAPSTFTGSVTVYQPTSPMAINLSTTSIVCAGANNGSAIASVVSGGTPPYSYMWSNNAANNPIAGSLGPGSISVTVTDANGCTASAAGNVSSIPSLAVNIVTINDTCFHSGTGSAVAITSGGSQPYTYAWSNFSNDSANIHLNEGTFTLTVTDNDGCTSTATATITGPASALTYTATQQNDCYASNEGSINITPAGGTPGYTYTWSPSNISGNNPTGLAAGDYFFTVTDTHGCVALGADTITQPASPLTLTASQSLVSCSNNDTLTITVGGGSPPYVYQGNTIQAGTTVLTNLPSGTYNITITDSAGCMADTSITITTSPSPSIIGNAVQITEPTCNQDNGAINGLIISGGAPPYTEVWDSSGIGVGNTLALTNAGSGTFDLIITDNNGCTADTSITLTATGGPALVSSSLQITAATCGNANGAITGLNASGGNPPYTEAWDSAGILIGNGFSLNNVGAGTFVLTITDAQGCATDTTITLTGTPAAIVPSVAANKDTICASDSVTICVTPANYVSYLWNNGDTATCITTNLAGNYYVAVTDNNQCSAISNDAGITVYTPPAVSVSTNGDTLSSFGQVSYQWYYNGTPIPGANSAIYVATQTGQYEVLVTDANGCQTLSNPVTVTSVGILTLQNGSNFELYPNPVSEGNLELITTTDFIGNEFRIYDVEGRLVYTAKVENEKTDINVSGYARGVYLFKISSAVRKFIKE